MRYISKSLAILLLLGFLTNAYSQNDEKYYYKLGKKYLITNDYETATKHFYKCASVARKNENENPNYYFYPLLMYYHGHGKLKQVNKMAEQITELVPPSPDIPGTSITEKEKYFNKFFDAYGMEINKSDYIFLRHFIHFQLSEMDVVETFDIMEFAVRYHDKKSVIPLEDSYKLMWDVVMKSVEGDDDPETSAAPHKLRLCKMFFDAKKAGSLEASRVVAQHCK